MKKLGETINPMKESFIVAFLNYDGQLPENQVVPKHVKEYHEKHGIVVKTLKPCLKAMKNEEKDGLKSAIAVSDQSKKSKEPKSNDSVTVAKESSVKKSAGTPEKQAESEFDAKTSTSSVAKNEVKIKKEPADAKESTESVDKSNKALEPNFKEGQINEAEAGKATDEKNQDSPSSVRGGKFAAMEKRKKDMEKPEEAESAKPEEQPPRMITKDSKGRLVKVIDDDDEEMDCEFLNNRQLFLNLCQGNHYQFDSLRRAKHTSMMVLWHLHNRDAPKFVQQCAVCSREILQGKRYHCPTCADFDQCIDCLRNPAIPRHPHQLQAIPVGSQQSTLTPEQRKERQRSIALHMTLLLHASTCRSAKCTSANCAKMKGLLKHGAGCKIKANGGCNVCKRIWALLQIHARQCKTSNCPVPNCMAIRERYRQLQLQQQAMDDRRRQMMNQTYHQEAR